MAGVPCVICTKTTYPAETISFEKMAYHVECFRCQGTCGNQKIESSAKAEKFDSKIYCKSCFGKGGFAQKQRNTKWVPKAVDPNKVVKPSRFGGGGNPCIVCAKTVYSAEQVTFEKKIYHGNCFCCKNCDKKIGNTSQAGLYEEGLYCKKCFNSLGFAQKQRKVKWEKKTPTGAAPAASKFGGGGTKCKICDKTVYAAETVQFEKGSYHAECMKCKDCDKKITPSNTNKLDDILYCSKCFESNGHRARQAKVVKSSTATTNTVDPRFAKFGGAGGTPCHVCTKGVYPAETVAFEKQTFHEDCFVCQQMKPSAEGEETQCKTRLKPQTAQYNKEDGSITLYCKKCWEEFNHRQC